MSITPCISVALRVSATHNFVLAADVTEVGEGGAMRHLPLGIPSYY